MAKRPKGCEAGSRYETTLPSRPSMPTAARPGSMGQGAPEDGGKLRELRRRCDARQSLHAPGDPVDSSGQWLGMMLLAGVIEAGDGWERVAEAGRRNVLRGSPNQKKPEGVIENSRPKPATPTPGARMRQARLQRRWSIRRLARLSGVPRSLLVDLEAGINPPCLWSIVRVAQALQVTADWIACLGREAGVVKVLCA